MSITQSYVQSVEVGSNTINIGIPPTPPCSKTEKKTLKVGFYEIYETIGKGNHAVVKLARHRLTKTEVAIKIIDKRRLDAENLKNAYREVEMLKTIHHPHIIRLYQVMESNNMIYLITEYAKHREIYDLIAHRKKLNEIEAREKFWQIVSAVEYLHTQCNVVHRDLKVENLLLDANNDIKLADFGFSNFYKQNQTLDTYCGSPPYAAPEIFEGKCYTGPEVDVWSLGCVLYVLVCGVLPFEGVNLQQLRDRVLSGRIRVPYFMTTDCENLIRKMLTIDPVKRVTMEQLKNHCWMRKEEMEPKLRPVVSRDVLQTELQEPHPQILQLMQTLGVDPNRVRNSLMNKSYDNFHGIYLMLLERLKASNAACIFTHTTTTQSLVPQSCSNCSSSSGVLSNPMAVTILTPLSAVPASVLENNKNRRRQSEGLRPRPLLNKLANHSTFQTTDCITPQISQTNQQPHPNGFSDAEENNTPLSRQSTIGTIGSIDEGVESDFNGSSQSRAVFSSSEMEPTGSGTSMTRFEVNGFPFELFDSQMESDFMSSLNSYQTHCKDTNDNNTRNSVNCPTTIITSNVGVDKHNFNEGWHSSDNSMGGSFLNPFPPGNVGFDNRAFTQLYRPEKALFMQIPKRLITARPGLNSTLVGNGGITIIKPPTGLDNKLIGSVTLNGTPHNSVVLKQTSLSDNLQFQPNALLNIKQSVNMENQLGVENGISIETKPTFKIRFHNQQQQKRLAKVRLQFLHQQSHQAAQKQSIVSANLLKLHLNEDAMNGQLSPIEESQFKSTWSMS